MTTDDAAARLYGRLEPAPGLGRADRCEASGLVPELARIADPHGIAVCSSGGFDCLTDKHRIGLWAGRRAIVVLHLGDHDPSGVHVFSSLAEDMEEFAADYGGDVEFARVAVPRSRAEKAQVFAGFSRRVPRSPRHQSGLRSRVSTTWRVSLSSSST